MDRDIIKAIKETRDFTLANLQIQKEILFELFKKVSYLSMTLLVTLNS